MKNILLLVLFCFAGRTLPAQISYQLEVDQTVDGNLLYLDFMINRPAGSSDFAFGSSNFSVFVNSAALNVPGLYKDASADGPWDNNNNPTNYFDLSVGHNNSNYVNMNINAIVGSPGSGSMVPVGRTRIGRLVIPITDPTQCNSITWRTAPLAIKDFQGNNIKSNSVFVNSTFCLPLCSNPPQFVSAADNVCSGSTHIFEASGSNITFSEENSNGANAIITPISANQASVQFIGSGTVKIKIDNNGCAKDTMVTVNSRPNLSYTQSFCSNSTVSLETSFPDTEWLISNLDSTLSVTLSNQFGNNNLVTINGFGSFLLTLKDTFTNCSFDTLITVENPNVLADTIIKSCVNTPISISVPSQNQISWTYPSSIQLISGGNANDTSIVFNSSNVGTDSIFVDFLTSNGCSHRDTILFEILSNPSPFVISSSVDSSGNPILTVPYSPVEWYRNDTLIVGETDSVLILTQNGIYHALYQGDCGTVSSDTSEFLLTAFFANGFEENLSVYPNPTKEKVTIFVSSHVKYPSFQIFNGLGQMVISGQLREQKNTIDVTKLSSGIYTVKIANTNRIFKLLIEK